MACAETLPCGGGTHDKTCHVIWSQKWGHCHWKSADTAAHKFTFLLFKDGFHILLLSSHLFLPKEIEETSHRLELLAKFGTLRGKFYTNTSPWQFPFLLGGEKKNAKLQPKLLVPKVKWALQMAFCTEAAKWRVYVGSSETRMLMVEMIGRVRNLSKCQKLSLYFHYCEIWVPFHKSFKSFFLSIPI